MRCNLFEKKLSISLILSIYLSIYLYVNGQAKLFSISNLETFLL